MKFEDLGYTEEQRKDLIQFKVLDERNIIDEYKKYTNPEIIDILNKKAFPYAVMMQHIMGDFNIGTVLRNANAFGAREAFYFGGRKHFDRRGACGVHNYTKFTHIKTLEDLQPLREKYVFVGIDNIPGAVDLYSYNWPEKEFMIVLGEEGNGLIPEIVDMCQDVVMIPQYGSVRSVNVGVASGIVMNDYISKRTKK